MHEQDYLDYLTLPSSLYEKIEDDVAYLFLELDIREYPVYPLQIAVALGYKIIPFNQMREEARTKMLEMDLEAISYYDRSLGTFVICYNSDCTLERLRFTIAHEIGHIRMGHKLESDLARRVADYYAAYLLAPTPWIGYAKCEDYIDVANKFSLSVQCAQRCFERYLKWSKYSFSRKYEELLMLLIT